jgi:hypothetical protein
MVMERTRMNTKRGVRWGLLTAAAACAAMAAMPGCELLVDFDRSKIPTGVDGSLGDDSGELPDAPAPTDGPSEGPNTAPPQDAPTSTPDATVDGGADSAATEASTPDTGTDAPVDTGADTGPDSSGTVVDAGDDSG